MIEFYAEIRQAHVAAVLASGALFLLRGLLVQAGRPQRALAPFPRYLSYAVDTSLLTAAAMLLTILPAAAFGNGWLAAKLALLPVYIGLGWLALRAKEARSRTLAFAGAIAAYASMYTIARAHHPLGPVRAWLTS
jgi:uncharacterized membrane protein SirB2